MQLNVGERKGPLLSVKEELSQSSGSETTPCQVWYFRRWGREGHRFKVSMGYTAGPHVDKNPYTSLHPFVLTSAQRGQINYQGHSTRDKSDF